MGVHPCCYHTSSAHSIVSFLSPSNTEIQNMHHIHKQCINMLSEHCSLKTLHNTKGSHHLKKIYFAKKFHKRGGGGGSLVFFPFFFFFNSPKKKKKKKKKVL